jgi:hypothetical protein
VLYSSSSIAPLLSCICHVIHNLFSSCRDDEEPLKDDTAAPSISPVTADEPTELDIAPRVTRASVKKIPQAQASNAQRRPKKPTFLLKPMHLQFPPTM